VEGENITLTANITNTGNLNATNLEVTFSADGFPFLSRRVDVPANGTNLTQAVWTARSGSHRLSVSLDPGNEIAEPVETNNTAEVDVAVNDRPRAVLSATPMSALTNETVEFNGSLSSDLSGGVAEYYFSFGDGNLSGWTASPVAYHSYPRNGFLTASLQVRDALGAVSDPTRLTIRVENRDPAAFPRSNATRALTFETVQFFSNASDPEGGVSLSWDFGDGSESSEKDPLHNYSKAGSYDVRLTVTDEDGASAASGLRVLIDDRPPACSIDAGRQSGTIEDEFVFTANASDPDGTISSWSWELGDGATSRSKQARHTYQRPGNYTVRLTVQDDAGSEARALAEVIVIDTPPEAKASLSAAQADTFKRVQFIGDRSGDLEGPVTFQWDFGDGNGSNEPSPYHAYSLPGDYNATLTVRDSAGQSSSITLPAVSIRNRQPKSDFRVFGCFTLNGTVYFDGTNSSDPEGPVTYSWDFGDGIRATGAVTEHVFTGAGSYSVNLTVTDTDGDSSILTQTVTVAAPPPPPPQPKKKPAVQDKTATVNALFGLSILLVVLLVAVAAWGVGRGKKRRPGPETVQMDTHPAPAPQAPDPAPPSYGGPPPGYRPPPQY